MLKALCAYWYVSFLLHIYCYAHFLQQELRSKQLFKQFDPTDVQFPVFTACPISSEKLYIGANNISFTQAYNEVRDDEPLFLICYRQHVGTEQNNM